jgi:hypothetical protein
MSKSGRQQMAYRNYVRKHIRQRQHALARAQAQSNRHSKLKATEVSEPKVSAAAEPVADPVNVFGSGASETESAPPEP